MGKEKSPIGVLTSLFGVFTVLTAFALTILPVPTPMIPALSPGGLVVVLNAGNNYAYSAATTLAKDTSFKVVAAVYDASQADVLNSKHLEHLDAVFDEGKANFHHMAMTELKKRIQTYEEQGVYVVGTVVVIGSEQLGPAPPSNDTTSPHRSATIPTQGASPMDVYYAELADTLLGLKALREFISTPYSRLVVVLQSNLWTAPNNTTVTAAQLSTHRIFMEASRAAVMQARKELSLLDISVSLVYTHAYETERGLGGHECPSMAPAAQTEVDGGMLQTLLHAAQFLERRLILVVREVSSWLFARLMPYIGTYSKTVCKNSYGAPVEASFNQHVVDALTSPYPKKVY